MFVRPGHINGRLNFNKYEHVVCRSLWPVISSYICCLSQRNTAHIWSGTRLLKLEGRQSLTLRVMSSIHHSQFPRVRETFIDSKLPVPRLLILNEAQWSVNHQTVNFLSIRSHCQFGFCLWRGCLHTVLRDFFHVSKILTNTDKTLSKTLEIVSCNSTSTRIFLFKVAFCTNP